MKVTGLVGPPGSGKSHHALLVAHERSIDLIIDDGLLIKDNHIIAGTSSKRQPTKVGAIKTALFFDENQVTEVRAKLKELDPKRILVLGTSEKMIDKICNKIGVPTPSDMIYINDIATEKQIEKARKIRSQYGKHVIPAPTVEVKSRFSGLLVDPLPTLFQKKSISEKSNQFMVNQTVVQPTFNFYGKFYIASTAINHIITIAAKQVKGISDAYHIRTRTTDEGIEISLYITVQFGYYIPDLIKAVKENIAGKLEVITSLYVLQINITVKKITINPD